MRLLANQWDLMLMAQSQSRMRVVSVQSGSPSLAVFQDEPYRRWVDMHRRSGHSAVLFGLQGRRRAGRMPNDRQHYWLR